jgi:predicted site-specific integrase-resolvase
MNGEFLTSRDAVKALGVHPCSLRKWADAGLINYVRTPGGDRRYNVNNFINRNQPSSDDNKPPTVERKRICYCRVSSSGQRDDLQRQITYMQEKYPGYEIISDIGSGINFKRKGFCSLVELACKGLIQEVVVAYRDRLCRFAFELVERVFQQHNVNIVVLNESLASDGHTELAEDLLAIINVYACRVNGKRKYAKKSKEENKQPNQEIDQASGNDNPSLEIVSGQGN